MLISRRRSRSASQQQLARLCRRQQTRDWPIGPTFGKLMQAASDAFRVFVRDGIGHIRPGLVVKADDDGKRTTLASLKVHDGRLVEWAATQKGTDSPLDRVKSGLTSQASRRDPMLYLSRATAPSPMHASPLPRNVSYRTVLPPMLDPLTGVEAIVSCCVASASTARFVSTNCRCLQQSAITPLQTALDFWVACHVRAAIRHAVHKRGTLPNSAGRLRSNAQRSRRARHVEMHWLTPWLKRRTRRSSRQGCARRCRESAAIFIAYAEADLSAALIRELSVVRHAHLGRDLPPASTYTLAAYCLQRSAIPVYSGRQSRLSYHLPL